MGLVHIYCGDGKGKTSAAVGLAVRAAGSGLRVGIVRFLKTDRSGEVSILKTIPGIRILPCEREFGFVPSMDEKTRREAAEYNLGQFRRAVELSGQLDLLILDEILAAVNYGMVPEQEVLSLMKERPEHLELVLTGRGPKAGFLELADYVSEIKKIKHPFDEGILARKGIEY